MAQALGSLLPTWKGEEEFQTAIICWLDPVLAAVGSKAVDERCVDDVSLPLNQINKIYFKKENDNGLPNGLSIFYTFESET